MVNQPTGISDAVGAASPQISFSEPAIAFVTETAGLANVDPKSCVIKSVECRDQSLELHLKLWPESRSTVSKIPPFGASYNFESRAATAHYLEQQAQQTFEHLASSKHLEGLIAQNPTNCYYDFVDGAALAVHPLSARWREGCMHCGASGKVRCHSGQGTNGNCTVQCSSCSGKGKLRCNSCTGGRVTTYVNVRRSDGSLGQEARWENCRHCGGTTWSQTCSVCYGNGRVRCHSCGGSGKLTCTACSGHKHHFFEMVTRFVMCLKHEVIPHKDAPQRFVNALRTLAPTYVFRQSAIENALTVRDKHEVRRQFSVTIKNLSFDTVLRGLAFGFEAIGKDQRLANSPPFLEDLVAPTMREIEAAAAKRQHGRALSTIRGMPLLHKALHDIARREFDKDGVLHRLQGGLTEAGLQRIRKAVETTYHSIGQQASRRLWLFSFVGIFLLAFLPTWLGLDRFVMPSIAPALLVISPGIARFSFFCLLTALPALMMMLVIVAIARHVGAKAVASATDVPGIRLGVRQRGSIGIALAVIAAGIGAAIGIRTSADHQATDSWIPKTYERNLSLWTGQVFGQTLFDDDMQNCWRHNFYCYFDLYLDHITSGPNTQPPPDMRAELDALIARHNHQDTVMRATTSRSQGISPRTPLAESVATQAPVDSTGFLPRTGVIAGAPNLPPNGLPAWSPSLAPPFGTTTGDPSTYNMQYLLQELGVGGQPTGNMDPDTVKAFDNLIYNADQTQVHQYRHTTISPGQAALIAQEIVDDQIHIALPRGPNPVAEFPNVIRLALGTQGVNAISRALDQAEASPGSIVAWSTPAGDGQGRVLASSDYENQAHGCIIADIEVDYSGEAYRSGPREVCPWRGGWQTHD